MTYGYIRVSTDRQDMENQKLGINVKATALGLSVEKWIEDDGISGTKEPEKRQLGKLMKILKKDDVILSSEISRLGRNLFMIMRILEFCMKAEVKVYTVKDGYELGDNIQSKVLAFAFGLAAEIERDMISKRTKEGLAAKRIQGIILGRPAGTRSAVKKCDAIKAKVIELNNLGLPISKIAKKLHVHRITLRQYMRENDIEPMHKNAKSTPTDELLTPITDTIIRYIKAGKMPKDMPAFLQIEHNIKVGSTRVINYISNSEPLHALYKETQQGIRIKANGTLNRSLNKL